MPDVIALDAMGGDDAPRVTVDGALRAAAEGIPVVLVGNSEVLGRELNARGGSSHGLRIVHAADVVEMGDKAAREVRRQRQTSLYVGTELVRDGCNGVVVAPGDAAALAGAIALLDDDPDRRVAMGAEGRATVRADFDSATEAARLVGLFSGATPLAGPPERAPLP